MKNKYTFSMNKNTVYCFTHYAGKTIRGIAKCDPEDEFISEAGMSLSKARCDVKVAKRKVGIRLDRYNKAFEEFEIASKKFQKAAEYYSIAHDELEAAKNSLTELEEKFR